MQRSHPKDYTMKENVFVKLDGNSNGYYALLGFLSVFLLLGFISVLYVEYNGHWVTNMNNRIAWGIPHVFAIFMILAASGALNIASIASVFNKKFYKPMSRLSGLLAILLLIGGLVILVLDLGRPDRLIVAMTEYNFKSIFAWNIILYTGFIAIVIVYLWFMFERKMNKYTYNIAIFAFVWRIILTSGTGSIFGFIVARQAYDSVFFIPMFVVMSFAFGLAIFILVLLASYKWAELELGEEVIFKLARLLGLFIVTILYLVIVYYLGATYLAEDNAATNFILFSDNIHNKIFLYGQILMGSIIPLILIYHNSLNKNISMAGLASLLVVIGGFSQLYVLIIYGQELPLQMFQGKDILIGWQLTEVFYYPSAPEVLLGLGGMSLVFILLILAMKILPFLPKELPNKLLK